MAIEIPAPLALPSPAKEKRWDLAGVLKRDELLKALSTVIKASAPRSPLAILANVLIVLRQGAKGSKGGQATLMCNSLETIIEWELVATQVRQEGQFTVPVKLLLDCVKNLPPRSAVSLFAKDSTLTLSSGTRSYELKGIEASEFPSAPSLEGTDEKEVEIDAQALLRAIKGTEFAAAEDDARPVLTALYCEIGETQLTVAAADAFRLTVEHLPITPRPGRQTALLIPARNMRTLADILPKEGDVSVQWWNNIVVFRSGPMRFFSTLVEGTYPNFRAIIPKRSRTYAIIGRKALTSTLNGLKPFARDSSNITTLTFKRGKTVQIEASAEEMGKGSDSIEAQVKGSARGSIKLNWGYLSDVATRLKEDEAFTFGFTSEEKPLVIQPVDREGYTYVIMPMSTNR